MEKTRPILLVFSKSKPMDVIIAPIASDESIIELKVDDLPKTSTAINGERDCWGNIKRFIITVVKQTTRIALLFFSKLI